MRAESRSPPESHKKHSEDREAHPASKLGESEVLGGKRYLVEQEIIPLFDGRPFLGFAFLESTGLAFSTHTFAKTGRVGEGGLLRLGPENTSLVRNPWRGCLPHSLGSRSTPLRVGIWSACLGGLQNVHLDYNSPFFSE
jgi:hypothetical protein